MTPKAREESLKFFLQQVSDGPELKLFAYVVTTLVAHEEQIETLGNLAAQHQHVDERAYIKCPHSVLQDSSCTLEKGHAGFHKDRDGYMVDDYNIEVDSKGGRLFKGSIPPYHNLCTGGYHFFESSRQPITCQCGKTGVLLPEGRVYRE